MSRNNLFLIIYECSYLLKLHNGMVLYNGVARTLLQDDDKIIAYNPNLWLVGELVCCFMGAAPKTKSLNDQS